MYQSQNDKNLKYIFDYYFDMYIIMSDLKRRNIWKELLK